MAVLQGQLGDAVKGPILVPEVVDAALDAPWVVSRSRPCRCSTSAQSAQVPTASQSRSPHRSRI